ncbi:MULTISPECIES: glutamate-5-semialdehyde dehydrogenase [unclassified Sporolactobacillus]|uniref:glutamate-5-semialdehyde dehydrogenase n=1 Tax=unclassified Sporolactobacillus TaxID=2628533 RepID=UPI00236782D1|nr:glutamate-5-semialdehyde dehydrogenase [Sporolactobacillus sp. CQH2019]MDD9148517.1 glutamate-5-semialdehyde dehydrogenase [Sporolactobacillus sp. CQH2019]
MSQIIEKDELLLKAEKARRASGILAVKATEQKNRALHTISAEIRDNCPIILAANREDVERAKESGMSDSLLDRLFLNKERIESMADALDHLAGLHDPIGDCIDEWDRPNGLHIQKIRVPLGVVGMVYEARPNVTADAAGLCLKTGNAVYLRGSASALESNKALVSVIRHALIETDLPEDSVQLLEDVRHETADRFFRLHGLIDVLIPRGSKKMIQTVVSRSTIPVLETGAGNCHLFIDESADPNMAITIALNAKTQRPSVCNAIETIIVHQKWMAGYGSLLIEALRNAGVECRIDPSLASQYPDLPLASENDWSTEYLDKIVAVKAVKNVDEAITHINRFGTKHSEAIVSESPDHVQRFFQYVDASTLYHNASTRFTDGEEFGFGAEIGISTQKLHARGPMGLPALTTIKYIVKGSGQIRQ